ncbi:hypothetical protein JW960_23605 [candidate division KSB1 bacterium]|nr:hypothetical protein [candidate division KSB1 bacterium]
MRETSESFPRNTLRQAELAKDGWNELMDKLHVPNLTFEEFEDKIKQATDKVDLAERLKEERSQAVKVRNETLKDVWDLTKRIRNAAKATFGDNSDEIEKFGGKPSRVRSKKDDEY